MPGRRRPTRRIQVGKVAIGGGAPISVQSMTNTDTRDITATVAQIRRLAAAGCEIVRLAVPDQEAALALAKIKAQVEIPLIADIHFDYRLALAALEAGVDGLRLNPGNIGGPERVKAVVKEAAARRVPIRIGVNAGSLEKEVLAAHGGVTAEAMVASALKHIRLLEDLDFREIKVSLKASEVPLMLAAYRLMAEKVDYPLHLGVTEAGRGLEGAVKSAVGIGILLAEGIGDTIRVSLTGDPVQEVIAGFAILRALGLRQQGIELISCPTCGRCQLDLDAVAARVQEELRGIKQPLKVAVMGCAVNGPGEARQADVGIAGGPGFGLLFRHGRPVRKVKEEDLARALVEEVKRLAAERREQG
ncbi:4-hydroxy-3-methylbut-2-en-1-yl diphosphate synthase (flavodoxin) [Moorella thermoacetica]|uniref:flavodoxin-dependent (E)-4-hydroxy-3-methylbut-2-enyl-diphosphate synthase n=1 Tax=Neomoorella thermoacetica TaxID=1525 RepID=UPI000039B700|nr:flavodoxin-dependent (E)-4-hydroxy-3-methylbut-2-enyl-diphosphate synthase [Moorella thermoacetica]AKX93804.1 4-hydroxy-3-methylbut-2-en-1-yl diphosphate synthase [Moorella thermoacetica]AKX96446.1 4-hydroxy-3-methylbut-2-en-1-yl diphosphate synthase [Moorella thermoacetica]OIQ57616.1 4-hydroxy-3-methylbut-2-en-1-yl diphosphate synthase [Moorella thermoacetica]QDA00260.1 4-hydroxy-3-methylbut-2-en-1-yl diphosphate synthase [Moorella thermoacetica]TYL11170.1 4-hydroxy-3-methylbut-2-en-1-yl d